MKHPFTWQIKKQGDRTLVIFSGDLNEEVDLSPLADLRGTVTFDMADVRRINSEGVTRWVNFVQHLEQQTQLAFIRCSVAVITQVNMIRGFYGHGQVKSFYAPYICRNSGEEEERLLSCEDLQDPLNPPVFHEGEKELELDEFPERYFAFLVEP